MRLKLAIIFVTVIMYSPIYAQDKLLLKTGELHGNILLLNDSIVKFKPDEKDRGEVIFKRKDVISLEYGEPLPAITSYKYMHLILNKTDTLMKFSVGDRLIWQCSGKQYSGRIARLENDQIMLTYENRLPNYVHIRDLCYIIKQLRGRTDLKILISNMEIEIVLSN